MVNKEEIREMCKKLNLYHLAKIKSFDLDFVDKEEFLKYLLEYEIKERAKSTNLKKKKASHMPLVDEKYKFTGIDKWNLDDLKSLGFMKDEGNLIIEGKCGKGKTTLAVILGNAAIEKGNRVYYLKQEDLLTCLKEKESNPKQNNVFNKLKDADLIVIDEMMYLPISIEDVVILYKGIMYLNDARSIIFITNRRLSEWKDMVEDKHTMETFVSRISNGSRIMVFK